MHLGGCIMNFTADIYDLQSLNRTDSSWCVCKISQSLHSTKQIETRFPLEILLNSQIPPKRFCLQSVVKRPGWGSASRSLRPRLSAGRGWSVHSFSPSSSSKWRSSPKYLWRLVHEWGGGNELEIDMEKRPFLVWGGEERERGLDLCLMSISLSCSHPPLWSWAVGRDQENETVDTRV